MPCDESEWLSCPSSLRLLEYLGDRLSWRKELLFGCACWHRLTHLLTEPEAKAALETAWHYADGLASAEEMEVAQIRVLLAVQVGMAASRPAMRSRETLDRMAQWRTTVGESSRAAVQAGLSAAQWIGSWAIAAEEKAQADLLRDIAGNPFRPVLIRPELRTASVLDIAQVVYREGRFEDLPILADALEDAGCEEQAILDHCRGLGPHTRGCWLVDQLLARQ